LITEHRQLLVIVPHGFSLLPGKALSAVMALAISVGRSFPRRAIGAEIGCAADMPPGITSLCSENEGDRMPVS
jgi:hypothetical protein